MSSSTILQAIAAAACHAPSVDNCQPWQMRLSDDSTIDLILDRQRAEFFGDWNYTASFVTLGCAVENMALEAGGNGLDIDVTMFPDGVTGDVAARITTTTGGKEDSLRKAIRSRQTNRYPFSRKPLPDEILKTLQQTADSETKVFLTTDRAVMQHLAQLSARIDTVIFSHHLLHENLFRWIRWNNTEAESTRDGLPVSCLGLAPPQRAFFRLISSWPVLRMLNLAGAHVVVGKINSGLLLEAGAIGIMYRASSKPEDYLTGGRAFQRLWLQATAQGLALHPFGGLPFLLTRYAHAGAHGFSVKQAEILEGVGTMLPQVAPVRADAALIGFFRIGWPVREGGRTLRRPLDEVLVS